MSKAVAELSGPITIISDRPPQSEIGDAARLQLALSMIEQVTSDSEYQRVAELLQTAASRIKTIEDEFESDKSTAHKLWKGITSRIARWTEPYAKLRADCEAKLKPYLESLEAAKSTAETQIRESGQAAKQELLDKAKELRRQGMIREAKALEEEAKEAALEVVLPDVTPEVEGLQNKRPWVGVCDSPMELLVALGEGKFALMHKVMVSGREVELPIVEVNMTVLNYYAKRLQSSMKIPGCHAKQEIQFAAKRSR
jgi:hypothetical protein